MNNKVKLSVIKWAGPLVQVRIQLESITNIYPFFCVFDYFIKKARIGP